MRRLALATALLLSGCGGSSHSRPPKPPPDFPSELLPAELTPTPTGEKVSTVKVRVYADDDYRAQTINWERKLSVLLRRVNKVLGPTAGLELELERTSSWSRKSSSSDMDAMLAELEELDSGSGVALVVGLTSALPQVTSSIHQLGIARPLGKHMVIRGLNDTKEVAVLGAALRRLSDESRDKLWSIRKKHKETVIFLHELGHVLGAMHVKLDGTMLYPTYDVKIARFSPETAKLMRIAASFRASEKRDRRAELEALRAYLAATKWPGWVPEEKSALEQLIAQKLAGPAEAPATEAAALSDQVRPADRKTYRAALDLADSGKYLEAWAKAEALFEFYPDEPALAVLACRLASAQKRSDVADRCSRAAELAPENVTPTIEVALAAAAGGDNQRAVAKLDEARGRLLGLQLEAASAWGELAAAYRKLQLPALAADAAGRSGGSADDVATWASRLMARYGVPPLGSRDHRLPPELDVEYIDAVKGVLKQVYAHKFAAAEKLAEAARRRFGPTSGVEAALCDLEIRRRRYPQARAHCRRALTRLESDSWAHYLLGLLEQRDKHRGRAIEHLARAIALDPELRHAYQVLAGLYRQAGKTSELGELESSYRATFGSNL